MTLLYITGIAIAGVFAWFTYWKSHAKHFPESGYTPPASGYFGELAFAGFAYLLTFLAVGKVKVIGKKPPRSGRTVFVGDHKFPSDFAMLRRGARRHFRMLTAADQLGGTFGVLSAAGGVISVAFKDKAKDGAKAQNACVKAVAATHKRFPLAIASSLLFFALGSLVYALVQSDLELTLSSIVAALLVLSMPVSAPSLGIFPQGGLLPDDPDYKENFRPGFIRIAREAAAMSQEPVWIVPMALYYEHDPRKAGLSHKLFGKMRSMFRAKRDPRYWNQAFKTDISTLSPDEAAKLEETRAQLKKEYATTFVTNYGGVVAVGAPINAADMPADEFEAAALIRARIVELKKQAEAAS